MEERPVSFAETLLMTLKRISITVIFLALMRLSNAQPPLVQAQFPAELDYRQTKTGGGIAYPDSKDEALFRIDVRPLDSHTTLYYPANKLSVFTNFSYFTNCALVEVLFSVHSSIPLDEMLYSITTKTDSLPQWKNLNRQFVNPKAFDSNYTSFVLEPVACRNQVFTVKLYHIKNPGVVLSQIVSTVPIAQPALFGKLIGYQTTDSVERNGIRVPKLRLEQKNLETENLTTLTMQEFTSGELFLNTNNSPYVYRVFLIRTRNGHTDTLPIYFIWAELTDQIIKANQYFDVNGAPYRNTYTASIPVDLIRDPGRYELLVVPAFLKSSRFPSLYEGKKASLKFEVYPSRVVDVYYVLLYSIVFLTAAILFFVWYKRGQKRKIRQQQQLAKEAKLKLEAIRAQLNPHFIFNALAGIQNLMNKNETGKAHAYLDSFSRITRSVLNHSSKETIPVEEEVLWLTDYLAMEQLRFGFQFEIRVDEGLDRHNVEIPAMLLQPFVENAVKHGISTLKEAGRISIGFQKEENNIRLSVSDNGPGFATTKTHGGAGLSLSKSRIELFNTIYKDSPARLSIASTATGTNVAIILKNWL